MKYNKIGFTGTRYGCTGAQLDALKKLLIECGAPLEAHHGDCLGADTDFHNKIRILFENTRIIGHIPLNLSEMGQRWWARNYVDQTLTPLTHFARNRKIVESTDVLLACPSSMVEEISGGTWYTINYARKLHKPICVIWSDGTLMWEGV